MSLEMLPLDVLQYIAIVGGVDMWIALQRVCKRFSSLAYGARQKSIISALTVESQLYGTREWKVNGCFHRENDQPAQVNGNEDMAWWYKGKLHRENDQPAEICVYGKRVWWFKGMLHRGPPGKNQQPAIVFHEYEYNGVRVWQQEWWFNGKRHRGNNQPAIICEVVGRCHKRWYENGIMIRETIETTQSSVPFSE